MGMFDSYLPEPALRCPGCGTTLEGWQGKEGPCILTTFKTGDVIEVCKDWRDFAFNETEYAWAEDDTRFEIYTSCSSCKRWVDAIGSKDQSGKWTATTIVSKSPRAPDPSEEP